MSSRFAASSRSTAATASVRAWRRLASTGSGRASHRVAAAPAAAIATIRPMNGMRWKSSHVPPVRIVRGSLIHLMYYGGRMLRPRERTTVSPYFPVGGPVPAADLVGRESYLRRLVDRLEDGNHVLVAGAPGLRGTQLLL